MYDLPHHKDQNHQIVKEFMQAHPFAFLTGCDTERNPVATQVPVLFEERNGRKLLTGHIMKNTRHHKAFSENKDVLVVFTGRHTYVSATWYSNPHVGSTWNYMSVQARGIIRFLDEDSLKEVLRKTTLHFENNNTQSATAFDNLPIEYTGRLIKAIIAFEIEITELDHVFKLSQDRDLESYRNIIEKLKHQDEDGRFIAAEMEKRTKALFPNS